MKTNKLIRLYTKANIIVEGVYTIKIPPKSQVDNVSTMSKVCGFVVPIKGQAKYVVNGNEYNLQPGIILHAGPSMKLTKIVMDKEEWEYILLHYRIIGDKESKKGLESRDYYVMLSEEQQKEINGLAKKILTLNKSANLESKLQKKVVMYQFIEYLLQAKRENNLQSDREKIDYISNYITEHLHEILTISKLAEKIGMTEKRFYYLFNKSMGISPKKYIIQTRINKAQQLILGTELTMTEIALQVGCEDALYFSRMFKKNTGLSPTSFRTLLGKSP